MARKHKSGKITMQVGAEPTESDIVVANVFARLGFDIEFIAPSRAYMVRTPDIHMDGLAWEIKCPESNKMDKIRQNIEEVVHQSKSIIIGTFRTPILDEKIIKYITKHFVKNRKIKRLKVVTKTHQVLDLK
jgi:hypothetical protein